MKRELHEAKEVLDQYFLADLGTKEEAKEAWEVVYNGLLDMAGKIDNIIEDLGLDNPDIIYINEEDLVEPGPLN